MTLAEWFKKTGVKQVWLAEKLDVSHATINNWLRGYSKPRARFYPAIAEHTGGDVTANDFKQEA